MSGRRTAAGVFAACFLISIGANAYMLAPASIVPLLVDHFEISKATAGGAISAAVLGSVLIQLPGGFLMDRYDNRRLLLAGTLVFAPVAVAGTLVDAYYAFLAARVLAGLAAGGLFVLGANVVAEVFAGRRQGFVTTLFLASAPVGFAVSQVGGPPLGEAFGWQAPFIAYPALAAVGSLLFFASQPAAIRTGDPISLRDFRLALGNRAVLLVSFAGFCSYMLYIFLNSWMPTYAAEQLPMTLGEAGTVAALLPAVGVLARPAGGWLSDRLGYRRRAVALASLGFALPAFFVISRAVSILLFAAVMLGVGFFLQFGMGVYYVYTRELAAGGTSATSLTVFTTISFVGTLVAPTFGGWLIESFAWGPAFLVHVGIGLLGIGLLVATPDSKPAAFE
ncbi:MFS transporter [Natronomonas amylolytica]|uniref:MFS transporter n=1 Tax=Natronomonas amylolytica TaxID=3108498 RepID=UPI00300BE386